VLIMMGQHSRAEALVYYFRLEDQVPEAHLLRLIDKHISFAVVRENLKESYSETGRPSIDPELLLRILLIGYQSASSVNNAKIAFSPPGLHPSRGQPAWLHR
jgi:transposase